jgi:lysophospholipase L1-like esterase
MPIVALLVTLIVVSDSAIAPPCRIHSARIQLFGDSTQEGFDGATKRLAEWTPGRVLQARLDQEFGAGVAFVSSRAMQGTTAVELVAGEDKRNPPWPQSVDANVVVVNHGINDMTHHGDLAAYRAALRTLAKAPAKVIFETPNVVKWHDLGPFAQAMREVAAEAGVPLADVYAYTSALPDWRTRIPDWAHPSSLLYVEIVQNVLAPAVIRALCQS